MESGAARWRANLLLYAAAQFVVLTTIAMRLYADHYSVFGNFFSELGTTHTGSGRSNHASMIVFSIAVATLGLAFVPFAGIWRAIAGARRGAGITAQIFGTLSGLAFVAVACVPFDVAFYAHNTLVVVAFALLLGYAIAMTFVWAGSHAPRSYIVVAGAYLVLVVGYFVAGFAAWHAGLTSPRGREILVVSQKVFVYMSIPYVVYLAAFFRRRA